MGEKRRKRRSLDRSVTRKVFLYAGGKLAKTIRAKISLAQAIKEIGKDPFSVEAALNAGPPIRLTRTLCKGVRIKLVWYGDHKIDPGQSSSGGATMFGGAIDAVGIARVGGVY